MEIDVPKTFKGYRLLACDGSDINIPYNPKDTKSYHQNADKRGYNQLHLNAFFDILNGIYIDCVLEPDRKSHERQAFNTMIDRLSIDTPVIIMADRGYEGYNLFAQCKKREYVEQEAWARLIVYNFCEAIARHIAVTKQSGKNTKHDYKINFATAACICKAYLKQCQLVKS